MQRSLFRSTHVFNIQDGRGDTLRLAFPNYEHVREAKDDIIDALKTTPCTVSYPNDEDNGSVLVVECPGEEWKRGARSILNDYREEP